jgi:small-conductance mechanosensitive channel
LLSESNFAIAQKLKNRISHGVFIAFVFSLIQVVLTWVSLIRNIVWSHYGSKSGMGFRHRTITTQFQFIERIIVIAVWLIGILSVLCSFEIARSFAKSLIASAGLVGLLLGFAAQKSLANLLAGFHIAFTQPIRLDDVVVIQGQWGRVEEITLTYVVVCLWDLRRLIVPINFFLENSFENWTKKSNDLLPYVLIHVDYSVPVDEIRTEFEKIIRTSPLWDGRVAVLHAFDATEKSLVLRALMSSSNASDAAELRFYVREKLIEILRERYPEFLPKFRFSNEPSDESVRDPLESLLAK